VRDQQIFVDFVSIKFWSLLQGHIPLVINRKWLSMAFNSRGAAAPCGRQY
jgi:hypothetical protein